MPHNFRKYFLPLLLLAVLLLVLLKPDTDNLNASASKIERYLNHCEETFGNALTQKHLADTLFYGNEDAAVIEEIEQQNFLLFAFQHDSLLRWTSSLVSPGNSLSQINEGTDFLRLKNGWYFSLKHSDTLQQKTLLALVPVKYNYPFQNKFLKNEFAETLRIPHNTEISEQKIPGSVPVKNLKGEILFSLYLSGDSQAEDINLILLLAQVTLLLILFYYIHRISIYLNEKAGLKISFSTLLLLLAALRIAIVYFAPFEEFYKINLFSPKLYASSVITESLGDLLLNTLLLFWLTIFFFHFSALKKNKLHSYAVGFLTVFVFAVTGLITWVFKTLVMDSVISFEVYNILSLDFYSVLGLCGVTLLMLLHFIISNRVVALLIAHKANWFVTGAVTVISVAVVLYLGYNSLYRESIYFAAGWSLLLFAVLLYLSNESLSLSIRNAIIYTVLYSLLGTFLIENLYERKERNQRKFFAGKLVTERDFIAEYMFDDIAQRISTDPFVKNFYSNPLIPKREITARLSTLYFSGYFNKYDLKVYAFDKHGNAIRSRDTTSETTLFEKIGKEASAPQKLFHINDTAKNYNYYAYFEFKSDTAYEGKLTLRLTPKIYYGQNVYPELLLGENVSSLADNSNYNYAIYQHDKLIAQHGDYPYTYYWNKEWQFGNEQYRYIDIGDWEHIIYRFANDKKVIVTIGQEGMFEPVATFSYLFSFFFLAVLAALVFKREVFRQPSEKKLVKNFGLSFRTRINYSMLLMILLSFVIIGFVTISFFRKQYDNFYNDRLLRKEKAVHATLEYFIQQNASAHENLSDERLLNLLNYEVQRLAEINDIDINLFDAEGTLAVTSQPAIFDKGLVSKKMNPDAFYELAQTRSAQITEQENAGSLKYLATYAPVRNNAGASVAYLGIPYFERSKNINDEVSSFLVALMNVYMFLLVCAAVLAYFISNSITRPLTIISEKLRILNLNKKNEPIEWNSNDEIGVLIGEYNKMIKELEQSALKLAKGERESAWREMAKQIAHEIKNPLTPMKLSIQYLQRAIDEGNPNVEQLAKRVTQTLEEQIENLSSIATAFSSFAQMPRAQNELINLNELLKSIVELFNREEKVSVQFTADVSTALVYADKNQLVSVFNNLIKNAMQSIPENRNGFIDVHVKAEGNNLQITVSDNGIGIPRELYEKVFVPNFTTKSSGTGLGLAISRQIIEGAGGKIWFESVENTGTSFFVQLPIAKHGG